jgi:hypothetical protein
MLDSVLQIIQLVQLVLFYSREGAHPLVNDHTATRARAVSATMMLQWDPVLLANLEDGLPFLGHHHKIEGMPRHRKALAATDAGSGPVRRPFDHDVLDRHDALGPLEDFCQFLVL